MKLTKGEKFAVAGIGIAWIIGLVVALVFWALVIWGLIESIQWLQRN